MSLDSAIRLNSGFSLAALLHTLLAVATCFVAITTLPGSPRAQEDWGASYITPFPQNDVYRMQVIGDWMAEGLFSAVNEASVLIPGSDSPAGYIPSTASSVCGRKTFLSSRSR